jgi:hypothetical protein
MSNIYKGYNPVYESLKIGAIKENKAGSLLTFKTIYDVFINILMTAGPESNKTPEGFKALSDIILRSDNFQGLQGAMVKTITDIANSDPAQKSAYDQYIANLNEMLANIKDSLSTKENFNQAKKELAGYFGSTLNDINNRQKTLIANESLVEDVFEDYGYSSGAPSGDSTSTSSASTKKRSGGERTGEEGKSEEGMATKWYLRLAKNVLDTATSFKGETSYALSDKSLAGDSTVQSFTENASKYFEQAGRLQLLGARKGVLGIGTGKLPTVGGEMKVKEFEVACQNLINEIIRSREEFNKYKAKKADIPAPPVAIVCPKGMVYDATKKACVMAQPAPVVVRQDDPTPTPKPKPRPKPVPTPTSSCDFPINISAKPCKDVITLQTHMMEIQCVSDFLSKYGGADGKYGKATAKVTNILYAYLTSTTTVNLVGDLTKEMFDSIMAAAFTQTRQPKIYGAKESKGFSDTFSRKIFEAEHKKKADVLGFADFVKIYEQTSPLAITPPAPDKKVNSNPLAWLDCVCASLNSGTIDGNCFKNVVPVPNPEEEEKKEEKKWDGLKPPIDNIYVISYDEGYWSFIGKAAIGAAIGVAVIASAGGALALTPYAVPVLGITSLPVSAGVLGTIGIGAATAVTAPVAVGAGAITGAAAADALSGRTSVAVSVNHGFIVKQAVVKMVRGLIKTLDGRVSDDDMQAIMATLCVIKGCWTHNSERTKAVSVWSEIKRRYTKTENEDLIAEINSIGTFTVSDVENFPDFDSPDASEGEDMNSDDAKQMIMEAISRLESNEAKLSKNIEGIDEEAITKMVEASAFVKRGEAKDSEDEDKESTPNSTESSSSEKGL